MTFYTPGFKESQVSWSKKQPIDADLLQQQVRRSCRLFPFRATLFWQGSSFLHGCWQRAILHQVGQGQKNTFLKGTSKCPTNCWQWAFLHEVGQGPKNTFLSKKKSYNFLSIPKIWNFINLIKTNSSLYLLHFFPNQHLLSLIAFITFPVALAKTAQALLQVFLLLLK